jgi:hypothetical protein
MLTDKYQNHLNFIITKKSVCKYFFIDLSNFRTNFSSKNGAKKNLRSLELEPPQLLPDFSLKE